MENTILHRGSLTAVLDSAHTVSLRDAGKLPTLDDIARQRARDAYMVPQSKDLYDIFSQFDK